MTAASPTPTPRDAVWEPVQFVKGDRVRVRISSECRVQWALAFPLGHPIEEDGVQGTVVLMPAEYTQEPWVRSHPYAVCFDRPGIVVDGVVWWGGMFAAAELVPLADHDRASEAAGDGGER